jgi:hypothetical protein
MFEWPNDKWNMLEAPLGTQEPGRKVKQTKQSELVMCSNIVCKKLLHIDLLVH